MDVIRNKSVFKSKNESEMKKEALKLCKEYLAGPWLNASLSEFEFSAVSGGLSNKLYHCALHKSSVLKNTKVPEEVLLRIYGDLQENNDIVVSETAIFMLLSERKLGPKLYGIFSNGRLEEYIPSRCLKRKDHPRLSAKIAREFAKIHALEVPISKHPHIVHEFIPKWLTTIEEKNSERKDTYQLPTKFYREEYKWLWVEMKKLDSPIVFCHNDLQGGNILLRNDSEDLMLIDFEFGTYNYRSFDFGNHFDEWCFDYNTKTFPHFEMDLKKFPSKEQQVEFITAYLEQLKMEGGISESISMEEETEKILEEVMVFRLASHLLWSTWSFRLSFNESCLNFAFVDYSKARLEAYMDHKQELLDRRQLANGSS